MKLISGIKKILFSRISVYAIGIVLQLGYLAALFWTLGTMFSYSYIVFILLGFALSIYIINSELSPEYKLIWIFTVLSFPVFGIMLYLFFGSAAKKHSRLHQELKACDSYMQTKDSRAKQALYISRHCGYPVSGNNEITYYKNGEELFPALLDELKRAQRYVFLEFFILDHGVMWDSILAILKRKAKEGVDVRVIYDDMGCLLTLPRKYRRQLEKEGIRCCVFGRLKPFWSRHMNNRDHRKILVIDNKVAFTGGINLADEYINAYEKHGYWKDSAVRIMGSAVSPFTTEFLKLWQILSGDKNTEFTHEDISAPYDGSDIAVPFFDIPDDNEPLSRNVYINILNNSSGYVYITTPYLIPDNEMQQALILAAQNGIDVRIITPHIPDKLIVHTVTRSYYRQFLKNGIRIYEFLPGFIHAKNIVSDDQTAVVGTVNLDFRSLYLHYECGVWIHEGNAVNKIKEDFIDTLRQCREINIEETIEKNPIKRIISAILRFFAPLM